MGEMDQAASYLVMDAVHPMPGVPYDHHTHGLTKTVLFNAANSRIAPHERFLNTVDAFAYGMISTDPNQASFSTYKKSLWIIEETCYLEGGSMFCDGTQERSDCDHGLNSDDEELVFETLSSKFTMRLVPFDDAC
jgi:hypothetical protein